MDLSWWMRSWCVSCLQVEEGAAARGARDELRLRVAHARALQQREGGVRVRVMVRQREGGVPQVGEVEVGAAGGVGLDDGAVAQAVAQQRAHLVGVRVGISAA
eukprot:scaffold89483_cov39-Phaeocystis_antarctica.AAC.1